MISMALRVRRMRNNQPGMVSSDLVHFAPQSLGLRVSGSNPFDSANKINHLENHSQEIAIGRDLGGIRRGQPNLFLKCLSVPIYLRLILLGFGWHLLAGVSVATSGPLRNEFVL